MLATRFAYNNKVEIKSADGFLTEDQMRASVPSIFADHAHGSRSARYAYIPTIEIVQGLAREGFRPVMACQSRPRDNDRRGFTKHMLRFRREGGASRPDVPEIIGINSHGGETSFQLIGGMFRFVCSNGMILGDRFDEIRVKHTGKIIDEVIEGTYRIVDTFERADDQVDQMKAIALRPLEQMAFAEAAAILRLDTPEGERPAIGAEQFNRARRTADSGADLWTTFNRIQENTIRGGLHGVTRDANNRARRMTTRPVEGIDQNVRLNRALWTLAERMAELKA